MLTYLSFIFRTTRPTPPVCPRRRRPGPEGTPPAAPPRRHSATARPARGLPRRIPAPPIRTAQKCPRRPGPQAPAGAGAGGQRRHVRALSRDHDHRRSRDHRARLRNHRIYTGFTRGFTRGVCLHLSGLYELLLLYITNSLATYSMGLFPADVLKQAQEQGRGG